MDGLLCSAVLLWARGEEGPPPPGPERALSCPYSGEIPTYGLDVIVLHTGCPLDVSGNQVTVRIW